MTLLGVNTEWTQSYYYQNAANKLGVHFYFDTIIIKNSLIKRPNPNPVLSYSSWYILLYYYIFVVFIAHIQHVCLRFLGYNLWEVTCLYW